MKTVQINPQVVFSNGQRHTAHHLHVKSVFDNLFDHVVFKYTLLDANRQHAGEGAYELEGEKAYKTWDATPEGAYQIVAAGLELVIVPAVGKSMFVGDK